MIRGEAIARLQRSRQQLAAMGVGGLYLYGSIARDEAGPESDIDLLVDPVEETFTIFDLARVRAVLADILNLPVDVHDYGGYLRLPDFRAKVGSDIVRVF